MSEFKPALLHKDLFKACMWVKRMVEEDDVPAGLACYKAGQYYGYSAFDVGWARNQLKQSQDKPGLFYSRGGPVSRKRPIKREKKIPLKDRPGRDRRAWDYLKELKEKHPKEYARFFNEIKDELGLSNVPISEISELQAMFMEETQVPRGMVRKIKDNAVPPYVKVFQLRVFI